MTNEDQKKPPPLPPRRNTQEAFKEAALREAKASAEHGKFEAVSTPTPTIDFSLI